MLLCTGYFLFSRTDIRQVVFLFGRRVVFVISTGAFVYLLISEIDDAHFSWCFCCCWSSILRISWGNAAQFFLLLLVSLECVIGLRVFELLPPVFTCCHAGIIAADFISFTLYLLTNIKG